VLQGTANDDTDDDGSHSVARRNAG
jgi:hypothetical protein